MTVSHVLQGPNSRSCCFSICGIGAPVYVTCLRGFINSMNTIEFINKNGAPWIGGILDLGSWVGEKNGDSTFGFDEEYYGVISTMDHRIHRL